MASEGIPTQVVDKWVVTTPVIKQRTVYNAPTGEPLDTRRVISYHYALCPFCNAEARFFTTEGKIDVDNKDFTNCEHFLSFSAPRRLMGFRINAEIRYDECPPADDTPKPKKSIFSRLLKKISK